MADELAAWREALERVTRVLPGSIPYENVRPIRVQEVYDGFTLRNFLAARFPFLDVNEWNGLVERGLLRIKDRSLAWNDVVAAGDRVLHVDPEHTEPDVDAAIEFLHIEDDFLVLVKPAPLPVHPSGKYCRHTVTGLLELAKPDESFHVVHRLDGFTTGVLILGRSAKGARGLTQQFEAGEVKKTYLARVTGHNERDGFRCDEALSPATGPRGARSIDPNGKPASTLVRVLERFDDGTSIVEAKPLTGRTHQIRLHLAHAGLPIIGDALYGDAELGDPLKLHALAIELRHPKTGATMGF
ncbi:MAG: RluA family pseudouridine synthase [Planctomycetota bacterium]